MTITKKCLVLGFLAFIFTQCSKENAAVDSATPTPESVQALAAPASVSYLLMGSKVSNQTSQVRQKIAQLGATETGFISKLNVMFVSSTNANFITEMESIGVTVGPDFKVQTPETQARKRATTATSMSTTVNSNPDFSILWGLKAISAPQAWALGYKGQGVRVAVLDDGMYLNHPDLVANINVGLSRNFVTLAGENNPMDASFTRSPEFSHATHVAGIIAGVDNTIGIVGVAPEAEIMAVKVLSDGGTGDISWIVKGIVYAADNGADVINLSLGGLIWKGTGQTSSYIQKSIKAYQDAIQYANSKGVTVICAAGNDAVDFDHSTGPLEVFPANSPHSLCISATSPENWYDKMLQGLAVNLDVPTSYTNFGSSRIDFAAPGGDYDAAGDNYYYDMVYSTGGPTDYYYAGGTSMAAPHASGVAALIIGKNGGSMSPASVKAKLRSSSDDLGKPGNDPYFGSGRVNALKAVQ